jgi:hypothetical protein
VAQAAVVLLEQARAKRDMAARARRLASATLRLDDIADLQQFAREFDAVAADLEQQVRRAQDLAAQSAVLARRSATLRQEVANTISETKDLVERLRDAAKTKPGA